MRFMMLACLLLSGCCHSHRVRASYSSWVMSVQVEWQMERSDEVSRLASGK